jgi:predicted PurR-regulated permease PerM
MPFEDMKVRDHARLAGNALMNWFIAACKDALCVGALWLVGLWIIGIPWAPLWAFIGGAAQFIPNVGPIIGLMGPAAVGFLGHDHMKGVYVLILYAIIVVVDGLLLQPYIMKRTVKVPIWASILFPLVMGFFFNFIGVLLSGPILAVIYAYKHKHAQSKVERRAEVIPFPAQPTDSTDRRLPNS